MIKKLYQPGAYGLCHLLRLCMTLHTLKEYFGHFEVNLCAKLINNYHVSCGGHLSDWAQFGLMSKQLVQKELRTHFDALIKNTKISVSKIS